MVDTVKEFINTTNLSYTDIAAGVTIVGNTASESAVVRDVVINNPSNRMLALMVGNSTVATVTGSARLTGTELVGGGTSLQLKIGAQPRFNEFYSSARNTTSFNKVRYPTLFDNDVFTAGTIVTYSNPLTVPFSGNPTFICFDANGNFYYAMHGTGTLYKRAGGVNGTQTSVTFGTAGYCYDGSRYIYAFGSGLVYTFDTQTGTATSIGCGVTLDPSYSYTSALDGWIYCRTQYDSSVNYLVNPASGAYVAVPGRASASAQAYFVGLGKDALGNYVVWQSNYTAPMLSWWNLGPNIAAPVVKQNGTIPSALEGNYASSSGTVNCVRQVGNTAAFYITNGSTSYNYYFDINTKVISQIPISDGSAVFYGPAFVPAPSAVQANSDFGAVAIRATGIKTT